MLGHALLRPQPMLLVPPPTHLSHHKHTRMDTRGCGSSSDMHCDVAKVHRACKCASRVRSFVRKPLAHTNGAQGFICMYGRAWGMGKAPGVWTKTCRGHADADVDRLRVVCTSSGIYRSGGMLWCKIGQKVVWERVCKWDAYSPPLAWGTVRYTHWAA